MRRFMMMALGSICSLNVTAAVVAQESPFSQRSDKQETKRKAAVAQLSAEGIANTATIRDEAMEPLVSISTEPAFKWRGGFTDNVRADNFARALLSRDGEVISYQIYQTMAYMLKARRFDRVNVMLPTGLMSLPLTVISNDVNCTYGCVFTDDVAFNLTENEVDAIVKLYQQDPAATIKMRYKSAQNFDWNDDIAAAEIVGLTKAIDTWQKKPSAALTP